MRGMHGRRERYLSRVVSCGGGRLARLLGLGVAHAGGFEALGIPGRAAASAEYFPGLHQLVQILKEAGFREKLRGSMHAGEEGEGEGE